MALIGGPLLQTSHLPILGPTLITQGNGEPPLQENLIYLTLAHQHCEEIHCLHIMFLRDGCEICYHYDGFRDGNTGYWTLGQ